MTNAATTRRTSSSSVGALAARVALGWTIDRPALLSARLGLELLSLAAALSMSAGACAAFAITSGAVADALAWGEYSDRAADAPRRPLAALLGEWFARALGWRALRALIRVAVAVAFGAMYVAALTLPAKLSGAPVLAASLTSLMYASAMVWAALTLAAVEIAPAGAIAHDLDLGESLLWGAEQVVTRPVTYYRALIVSTVVMLPGIALAVLAALAVGTSNLYVSLQLTSQLAALTGGCALALAFRGASVAIATGALVDPDDSSQDGLSRILPSEGADAHLISLSSLRSSLGPSTLDEEE